MVREFSVNLTFDSTTGRGCGYICEVDQNGEYSWLSDTEFGPFDVTLDVSKWLCRTLDKAKALRMR